MGDDVALQPNLRLSASLPAAAKLILFKDGQAIASTTASTWQVPVTEPGAYRLEASRYEKPWIFSNPIYIHAVDNTPAVPELPTTTPPSKLENDPKVTTPSSLINPQEPGLRPPTPPHEGTSPNSEHPVTTEISPPVSSSAPAADSTTSPGTTQ